MLVLLTANVSPAQAADSCSAGVAGERCIIVDPDYDVNPIGTDHTVNALATYPTGDPIAKLVTFKIISGPNAGAAGVCNPSNCTSLGLGDGVSFTYTSNGVVGIDTIEACADFDAPDETLCAQVQKEWVAEPPPPPPSGGQGCTPGYWKQDQHLDSWVGYNPFDDYGTVFGVTPSFSLSLLDTLGQGGGGEKALGRHAVAALLSAANPDVSYSFSEADVIAMVQDAYASGDFEGIKNLLAVENETGCPLN